MHLNGGKFEWAGEGEGDENEMKEGGRERGGVVNHARKHGCQGCQV